MTCLFAGGIRNTCSTSYINSTLQVLLHFKPFTQLLADSSLQKNYLVKVLYTLYNKITETLNNISADSIISYFHIDPRYLSDAQTFMALIYSNLPSDFHQIIFFSQIIKVETPTNINQIASNLLSNSILNTHEMIIFTIETESSNDQLILLNPDDQINFNGQSYQFYGFIQSMSNQYYFIMHDSIGWINCHDSSLSAIPVHQVRNLLSDFRMQISIIIFVKSLDLIEFSRRKPTFQNIRHSVNFTSAPSTQEDSQIYSQENFSNNNNDKNSINFDNQQKLGTQPFSNIQYFNRYRSEENNLITRKRVCEYPMKRSSIFYRDPKITQPILIEQTNNLNKRDDDINAQDSIFNSSFTDTNQSTMSDTVDKYDESTETNTQNAFEEEENDDVIPLPNNKIIENQEENEYNYLIGQYIDPKTNYVIKQYKIKLDNGDYKGAAETIKYQLESDYHEKFQYRFKVGSKFTSYIPFSLETEQYAIFTPMNFQSFVSDGQLKLKYSNNEKNEQTKYNITVKILNGAKKQLYREFKGNQRLSDIKTLVELFLDVQNIPIYFYIVRNKKIFKVCNEDIQIRELWEISNHHIEIIVSLDSDSQKNFGCFRVPVYQTFGHFRLIKNIQLYVKTDETCQHLIGYAQKYLKTQLEVIAFDDIKKQFITFQHNEKLYKIFDYQHLRIQSPIPKNSIVFLYETPFAYTIKDNQTLSKLKIEIGQYLNLTRDFFLEYNKKVSDANHPSIAWKKGLFQFMIIKFKSNSSNS